MPPGADEARRAILRRGRRPLGLECGPLDDIHTGHMPTELREVERFFLYRPKPAKIKKAREIREIKKGEM